MFHSRLRHTDSAVYYLLFPLSVLSGVLHPESGIKNNLKRKKIKNKLKRKKMPVQTRNRGKYFAKFDAK